MPGDNRVFSEFEWLHPPGDYQIDAGVLELKTDPDTDFWQRTHYGFRRHNGHAFLMPMPDRFSLTVKAEFYPEEQYDQCGLFLHVDADNWAKASIEYETPEQSRLGSVVTNFGYSDWATTDISSDLNHMYYRVSRKGSDFLFEHSEDGEEFFQMRIFHLHAGLALARAGLYACSPKQSSFTARFLELSVGESVWKGEG